MQWGTVRKGENFKKRQRQIPVPRDRNLPLSEKMGAECYFTSLTSTSASSLMDFPEVLMQTS